MLNVLFKNRCNALRQYHQVVEGLKNAMLACTFSMVVLGLLFLYTGFFVKVHKMFEAFNLPRK